MDAISIADAERARLSAPEADQMPGPTRPAMSAVARKLDRVLALSIEERAALDEIQGAPETVRAGINIIREGDHPTGFCVLVEGWAYRYKRLPGGRRQIFSILLPGDLCEIRSVISSHVDHGVCTLTPATIVRTPSDKMLMAVSGHPRIAEALWRAAILDEAILRAWLFNLGLRKAPARMAHLFCELAYRMVEIGGSQDDGGFPMPLTQQELGDGLGLTSVHVNRVLQHLRAESLIDLRNGVLHILDVPRLRALGEFDERYLRI